MQEKKSRFNKLFTLKGAFFAALIAIFVLQFFQIQGMRASLDKFEETNSSLITEIGQIKGSYTDFTNNINEVRTFLRMPEITPTYSGPEAEAGESESTSNENELQLAMFRYLEYLNTSRQVEEALTKKRALLDELATSPTFQTYLNTQALTLSAVEENDSEISLTLSTQDPFDLVVYVLNKGDGSMFLNTPISSESISYGTLTEFETAATDFLDNNKDKLIQHHQDLKAKKQQITNAINNTEVQAYLTEKFASISTEPSREMQKLKYVISNRSGEEIGMIILHSTELNIHLVNTDEGKAGKQVGELSTELLPFLKTLRTETYIERQVNEAKSNLETTIKEDKGFQSLIKQSGLQITSEPREDEDRYYYDILDADGNFLSALALEKATGVVNIVDEQGTGAENLLFFDPSFGKKKTLELPEVIPEYGDELTQTDDTFNILIAGRNGNLIDTMIFAHVNETKGNVRMISVPRDLYYNGRKINSLAYYYGMPELIKALSKISGYELDKYVLIDLEAFIDVIDLIGGVEVTLEKALIDPTYRTVDNGVEGTLHYEPGTYHLGGVESLRLARSRYTSSDFARAERQQLILKAIQEKARNFGFGDADTLYEIAKTVIAKTETDVEIDEALVYYFKYQNYEIESNVVMSSGNVLYSPPYVTTSQCDGLIAAAEAAGQPLPDCRNKPNAYMLLPRNDNWNIVKWFFKKEFEQA